MFAIYAGVVAFIALVIWLTSPTYSADEPRPVMHYIPFLGHALSFAYDKRRLYKWADLKSSHSPFSLFIAGKKHYIFHSPADIMAINRNSRSLSIQGFVQMLQVNLFGMTPAEALKHREGHSIVHPEMNTYLLKSEHYDPVTSKYFAEQDLQFRIFDKKFENQDTVIEEVLPLVTDLQGIPTTNVYFGRRLLEANPDGLQDLTTWIAEGFWKSLLGLPGFIMKRPIEKRNRLTQALKVLVDEEPEDRSPYLHAHFQTRKEIGWSNEMRAKDLLGFFFAVNANSLPTTYSALLRLAADPSYLTLVRSELLAAGYDNLVPADYISIIPQHTPHLRSLWHENLRYHSSTLSVREVLTPTSLSSSSSATYNLQTGNIVVIPSTLVHGDERLHPNPEEFRIKRFLPTELGGDGEDPKVGVRPFGGGVSYCPGRVFAEKQVLGTLAGLAMRYDMEVVEGKGRFPPNVVEGKGRFPPNVDFEVVTGLKPVKIAFRKRKMEA